jgi:hypothetical protein
MSGPSDDTLQAIADYAQTASREALEQDYIRLSQRALVSDLAAIDAKREAAERSAAEANEQARIQREAAATEQRETTRRAAWLQAYSTRMQTAKPDVPWAEVTEHARVHTPKTGWPDEYPESTYFVAQKTVVADDVSETFLGQIAKQKKFRT